MNMIEKVAAAFKAALEAEGMYVQEEAGECFVDGSFDARAVARAVILALRAELANLPRYYHYADGEMVLQEGDGEWVKFADIDSILTSSQDGEIPE